MTTPPPSATVPAVAGTSSKRPLPGAVALAWWKRHCHPVTGDPGVRARLRRARTTLDALRITAAASLARQLGAVPRHAPAPDWKVRAALDLARVLAHVSEHELAHPMRAAGWKCFPGRKKESDAGKDRPLLSEARFRRLLETGEGEEKAAAFIRLVALLGGAVNVEVLAADFLDWNHPEYGARVRERWAFNYLAAGDAAPAPLSPETEDDGE